jgi:hypothetical protein
MTNCVVCGMPTTQAPVCSDLLCEIEHYKEENVKEHEFIVTGRIIIGAHCQEDANAEAESACSELFLDFDIRPVA